MRSHDHEENDATSPWIPALDTSSKHKIKMADDVSLSFFASLLHNYSGICQIRDSKTVLK